MQDTDFKDEFTQIYPNSSNFYYFLFHDLLETNTNTEVSLIFRKHVFFKNEVFLQLGLVLPSVRDSWSFF